MISELLLQSKQILREPAGDWHTSKLWILSDDPQTDLRFILKKGNAETMNERVLHRKVQVGNRERRFLQYIPPDVRSSTAEILFIPPNGITAQQAFEASLLPKLAEGDNTMEKFIVTFLEPESDGWHIEEPYGCDDGDVAYVAKVYEKTQNNRAFFCIHEAKHYIIGVGEGGSIAGMTAMWNPSVFAGLAMIGHIQIRDSYMSAAKADFCTDFHGFSEPSGYRSIRKGDIPLPVWLISDERNSPLLAYWQEADGITADPRQVRNDTWEWVRTAETDEPLNRDKEAYRVRFSTDPDAEKALANRWLLSIYKDFLFMHRRWMGDPAGDLRMTLNPLRKEGMEYHFEEIAGFQREWYLYVPQVIRDKKDPVPLVLALHGYSCSGEIYAGHSGWCDVADRYGFIVAFPTALPGYIDNPCEEHETDPSVPVSEHPAWNFLGRNGKPDEFAFFSRLLSRISEEHPVDQCRIYVSGHSHGSMMAHSLGMAMTDRFAAIAPLSGTMFSITTEPSLLNIEPIRNRRDAILPCWMFVGEKEEWLIPAQPEKGNKTAQAIEVWCAINHIPVEEDRDWHTGWTVNGTWHTLDCRNAEGVSMVRETWIEGMPHAVTPKMTFAIWEQFFSKFRRDGKRIVFLDDPSI